MQNTNSLTSLHHLSKCICCRSTFSGDQPTIHTHSKNSELWNLSLAIIRQSAPTQRTVQYDPGFSYCKIIIFYTLLLRKYWPLNLGRSQVITCTYRIYYINIYTHAVYELFNSILTFFFLFSNSSIHSGVLSVSSISDVTQYIYATYTLTPHSTLL